MMHGLPPFYNKSQSLMFKLIKEGEVKFSEKVKITPEAQDFILKILNKNPKQRLGSQSDVDDILAHPWFKDLNKEKMLKKEVRYYIFRFLLLSSPRSRVTNGCKASTRSLLLN
jgi:serine/threonine protein kinase